MVLSAGSVARWRPGVVEVGPGFWADRRRAAREVGVPHTLAQLRAGSQLADLREVHQPGKPAGRPFHDSDVYKTAEAVAWCGGGADALLELLAPIVAAQTGSGYLNSWFQRTGTPPYSDLAMGHELYCAGHLIQAAVAVARTGHGDAWLAPAVAFADHLVDTFGDSGLCGHPQIETALVELFRHTGRRSYLDLAGAMVDRRGRGHLGPGPHGADYYQDSVPLRESTTFDGHCVRALYLATGAADVYLETGDRTLLEALTRLWDDTVATKTYVTGGVGCRRKTEAFGAAYELPPDQAFNESCAGVANVMWGWRMLLATGRSHYADHIERVLFNVVAAAMSLRGDRFSYVNTLHRRGTAMEHGDKAPYRKPWFGCPCCPPNVLRLLGSLGHYAATVDGSGVQVHQFLAGRIHGFELSTDYPWSGGVTLTSLSTGDGGLSLRIPGWCHSWTLAVNGRAVDAPVVDGYAVVRHKWREGDTVRLELSMPPRFTEPDPRIDAVRGCLAVERGPLVYCVEVIDQPVGLDEFTVDTSGPLREAIRPDLLGGLVTVTIPATTRVAPRPSWPYGGSVAGEGEPVMLTAIPYYAWDNRGTGPMRVWLPR